MLPGDETAFFRVLERVAATYQRPLTTDVADLYFLALKPFPFEEVMQAITRHLADPTRGRFWPMPADITRFITGSGTTLGLEAWARVLDAIRRHGGYASVVFDDPIIHVLIQECGGWPQLCAQPSDELRFIGQSFARRYDALAVCPPRQWPAALYGREAISRSSYGQSGVALTVIGDRSQAEQVYQQGQREQLPARAILEARLQAPATQPRPALPAAAPQASGFAAFGEVLAQIKTITRPTKTPA